MPSISYLAASVALQVAEPHKTIPVYGLRKFNIFNNIMSNKNSLDLRYREYLSVV